MLGIDWNNLQFHHYLAIGGGVAAVLAIIVRLALPKAFKVPAAVLGIVAALAVGVFIGIVTAAATGVGNTDTNTKEAKADGDPEPNGVAPVPKVIAAPKGVGGPGNGKAGGKGGAKGGAKGTMAFGPSPKVQLTGLIAKLDQLADKPVTLTIKLSNEQREAISEQIKGLADLENLSDDDAKRRLDAILDTVKRERATLEAAGFRWPGPFAFPMPTANPFKDGEYNERLTSLTKTLNKKQ